MGLGLCIVISFSLDIPSVFSRHSLSLKEKNHLLYTYLLLPIYFNNNLQYLLFLLINFESIISKFISVQIKSKNKVLLNFFLIMVLNFFYGHVILHSLKDRTLVRLLLHIVDSSISIYWWFKLIISLFVKRKISVYFYYIYIVKKCNILVKKIN